MAIKPSPKIMFTIPFIALYFQNRYTHKKSVFKQNQFILSMASLESNLLIDLAWLSGPGLSTSLDDDEVS